MALPVSLVGHSLVLILVVLLPILLPSPSPEHPDYIRALIYNPPPPPPPPLNKGSALVEKPQPTKPVTPDPTPETTFVAPVETPKETPLKPESKPPDTDQVGSETGSDLGIPEGMEEGVEGGVLGGVPGGVLGGVVGGTGDGPVLDYDQAAKPVRIARPVYPQEAFVKKIEGTVEIEIVIDANGRVVSARIIRSIPLLDAAALECVRQWLFTPAMKHGRPVATVARAPVTFRIF